MLLVFSYPDLPSSMLSSFPKLYNEQGEPTRKSQQCSAEQRMLAAALVEAAIAAAESGAFDTAILAGELHIQEKLGITVHLSENA